MAEPYVCAVCGDAVDEKLSVDCHSCGSRYHLNPRNDDEGKDCGAVWINEHHLALEFACQRCLDESGESPQQAATPQPDAPAQVITPSLPPRKRYRRRD